MINLSDLPFFKNFPKTLVAKLQQCAVLEKHPKGHVVISQGESNNCLYFLVSGLLNVYVDDGLVATLKTQGDLIGEMSLISQQASSATIKADSSVELLKIDGDSLHKLAQDGETGAENLYKIYSDILVQKLEATNHRAKKIEAFVKELESTQDKLEAMNASLEIKVKDRTAKIASSLEELKQKNTELQATHEKLKDLYQSRDITFGALETLLTKNLAPLKKSIGDIKKAHNLKSNDFDKVQNEVTRAIHMLEPLTASFKAEKSMTAQKVLLAEPIKKQQNVAKMALGGTGVELEMVETVEEAKQRLTEATFDIFMFSEDFLGLTEFARKNNPEMKFVFVTSQDIPQYVPTLLKHTFVPNVVFRDEEDKQFTIKNFVTTVSKLASQNYFGLEKYISWGVEVKEIQVASSDQRPEVIQQMDDYFANMGIRSSNRGRLGVVAEELLMNAIYDAPSDGDGKPLYNHQSRTEVVQLQEAHRPRFRFATDGVLMAVSIEDPFGGLNAQTLFRYLEKCYSGGSLNDGRADKGGGGRGLHQIIENSDLVVFNIDPGQRTEVIALFNTDQKVAAHRNPNLHFFKVA